MRRSRIVTATRYALAITAFLILGLAGHGALAQQRPALAWLFTWGDKQKESDKQNETEEAKENSKDEKGGEKKDEDEKEDEEAKEEPLESDRPDFTEASTTVGYERLQIEAGYRYTLGKDGEPGHNTHDLPELLVRYGLAERLELRIAWDEGMVFDRSVDRALGRVITDTGSTDVEFGFKYALTKQKKWLPQSALIVAVTAPVGSPGQTSGQVDDRINYCYSWQFTKQVSLNCSTGNLSTRVSNDHFSQFFHSMSVEYELTEKLHVYNEWFVICRLNANDNRPQHYYDGGLTYLVTPNFQLDWSAGIGLSETSDRFFTGCGLTVRR